MKIDDVELGDIYYVRFKGCRRRVIKGEIIEISRLHETVLVRGFIPYTEGNFGALLSELYKTKLEAYEVS